MKVGLVLPDLPKYSETFLNHKIEGLKEAGFDVMIFTGSNSKNNSGLNVRRAYPVYESDFLKQLFASTFLLLKVFMTHPQRASKLFLTERKDGKSFFNSLKSVYFNAHIISENLDCLHFGFATMSINRENVAKVLKARMSVSFRGYDINIYPLKNPGCYERLWKNVDKVHTISGYLREKAIRLGLDTDKPFEKITPAIDIRKFKLKSDAGIFHDPVRIFTVGRLNWIKDFETAISAMSCLKKQGINFIYKIAGDGKELERLRYAVFQNNLQDRIFFLGQIEHEKVNEQMQNSDIYLQTSMQEGFCVSVLEAQASGLLCVVSDADGLKENVIDGETGFVAEKRNPEEIASRITDTLNLTNESRKQIAMKARERVEKDFNMEDQKNKFKKFFSE